MKSYKFNYSNGTSRVFQEMDVIFHADVNKYELVSKHWSGYPISSWISASHIESVEEC